MIAQATVKSTPVSGIGMKFQRLRPSLIFVSMAAIALASGLPGRSAAGGAVDSPTMVRKDPISVKELSIGLPYREARQMLIKKGFTPEAEDDPMFAAYPEIGCAVDVPQCAGEWTAIDGQKIRVICVYKESDVDDDKVANQSEEKSLRIDAVEQLRH